VVGGVIELPWKGFSTVLVILDNHGFAEGSVIFLATHNWLIIALKKA
jgi:hypothetical protein